MTYEKFNPTEQLRPFVECYYVWESQNKLEHEFVVESPPSGYCSIVINYGDPYFLQNIKYEKLQVPKYFISGQSIYSYKLFLTRCISIAGIVLKPAALASLFHLSAYEFAEERIDLFKVFDEETLQLYINRIKEPLCTKDRVKILEELLLQLIRGCPPQPDYIDDAANLIIDKKGMLNVSDLVKDSCMSRRTFERKFFQKVGLSPKYYARIRRIGYICNLIAGKQKVNWKDLFYECEFYDQAHFIKDFEEFTGRTPQQYLLENTELAN